MSAGPFIVTHTRPCGAQFGRCGDPEHATAPYREAFATSGETQAVLCREVNERLVSLAVRLPREQDADRRAALALIALEIAVWDGADTEFRLPNGDVIEVEATTYGTLVQGVSRTSLHPIIDDEGTILAAWNVEYGIGIEREER